MAAVRAGNLVFLSGQLPWDKSGKIIAGQVGKDLDVPVAYEAAKLITLGLLGALRGQIGTAGRGRRDDGAVPRVPDDAPEVAARRTSGCGPSGPGDLDKVKRIVKVTGLVNCDASFTQHPQVINGCSDLLVTLFGDKGRHARVAAGYVSLPLNAAVEIDMIAEVEDR